VEMDLREEVVFSWKLYWILGASEWEAERREYSLVQKKFWLPCYSWEYSSGSFVPGRRANRARNLQKQSNTRTAQET